MPGIHPTFVELAKAGRPRDPGHKFAARAASQ